MNDTYSIYAKDLKEDALICLLEADGAIISPSQPLHDIRAAIRARNWVTQPIAQIPLSDYAPLPDGFFIPDRRPGDPGSTEKDDSTPKENTGYGKTWDLIDPPPGCCRCGAKDLVHGTMLCESCLYDR